MDVGGKEKHLVPTAILSPGRPARGLATTHTTLSSIEHCYKGPDYSSSAYHVTQNKFMRVFHVDLMCGKVR